MSSTVCFWFACSYSLQHHHGSDDMGPVVNWQQKGFRGVQFYHSLESTKEEEKKTQDSTERMSRRVSQVCEKTKAAVRVTISHLQLQTISSLSFSAGSGKRSLSPLL